MAESKVIVMLQLRIAELTKQREDYVQAANQRVAAFSGAIDECQALLEHLQAEAADAPEQA